MLKRYPERRKLASFQLMCVIAAWSSSVGFSLLGPGDSYSVGAVYDVIKWLPEPVLGGFMVVYSAFAMVLALNGSKDRRAQFLVFSFPLWLYMGSGALISAWWKSGIVSSIGFWEILLSGACCVALKLLYEEG